MGKAPEFVIYEYGTIQFHNRVCVPTVEALKKKILDEATILQLCASWGK